MYANGYTTPYATTLSRNTKLMVLNFKSVNDVQFLMEDIEVKIQLQIFYNRSAININLSLS